MRHWWKLALLAVLASCFGLSLGDEPFVCGTGGLCPSGYECLFNVCTREGKPDAAVPDALVVIDATCAANGFLSCNGDGTAQVCNGDGTGILTVDCPGGCDESQQLCVRCTANAVTCVGDTRIVCGPKGDVVTSQDCAAGCDPSPPATCLVLVPSNLPEDACAVERTRDVDVDSSVTFDTTNCAGLGGEVIDQGNGETLVPSICLVHVRRFTVDEDVTLTVKGSRPLAVVATDRIEVRGTIDVSADGTTAGPGAEIPFGPGTPGGNSNDGGGGAGFVVPGGTGGQGIARTGATPRPAGGVAYGDETLSPLVAGSQGGAGGTTCNLPPCQVSNSAPGGGGGGGLELVGCRSLTIGQEARLKAGGGGGPGGGAGSTSVPLDAGVTSVTLPAGGSGGGSGGAILLEAPQLFVPNGAKATAAGGGGGGGAAGMNPGGPGGSSEDENPGTAGTAPVNAGQGGVGGGTAAPEAGEDARPIGSPAGGGGGGAAGRIRLNARPDKAILVAPGARVVPAASKGEISRRRDE